MQVEFAHFVEARLQYLAPLLEDAVLVGGAAVGLVIDELGAAPARATNDIDLIVAVDSRLAYEAVAERLHVLGLTEDMGSSVICRWRHQASGAICDVMPTGQRAFGFDNVWYAPAFKASIALSLPGGLSIRCASAPYLLAMKLVAWESRGKGDAIASHDMNDIMAIIDGVTTIVDDTAAAAPDVLEWIAHRIRGLINVGVHDDAILGYLYPDAASQARRPLIEQRLQRIASMYA